MTHDMTTFGHPGTFDHRGRLRAACSAGVGWCLSQGLRLLMALPLVAAGALAGCGYHTLGSATHIPTNVHTLDVPIFTTHILNFNTEAIFTQAVVRELNTRTTYMVLTGKEEDADAHLSGTILSQSIAPLTYDSASGQTASYLITITARVVLKDRAGHVLYENDALPFHDQYQSTEDLNGFFKEDTAAVQRIARDFAQTVVSNMLE